MLYWCQDKEELPPLCFAGLQWYCRTRGCGALPKGSEGATDLRASLLAVAMTMDRPCDSKRSDCSGTGEFQHPGH